MGTPHTRNALTVKKIEHSKKKKERDGGGLWLVTKGRARYWILDYRFAGRRREMGLGPLHSVGLAEAREKAEAARALLRQGVDPVEHRQGVEAIEAAKAVSAGKTFGQYCDDYIDEAVRVGRWRGAKTEYGWRSTLTTHAAAIRNKAIADIDVEDILKVVRPLWGVKHETARKAIMRLEQVLSAAKVEGLRQGDNPAAWRDNLEHVLQKPNDLETDNQPSLPWAELPAFMVKLRAVSGTAARALEFTILTAVRSGETRMARWSQFDFEAKVWNVPAPNTKGGKPRRVPLSDAALALIKAQPRFDDNEWVFSGIKSKSAISGNMQANVLKALHSAEIRAGRKGWLDPRQLGEDGKPKPVVPHGFRSAIRDWVTDATSHPREVVEMVLAHVVGDQAERAYARSDALEKRRLLLAEWALYCDQMPH